MKKLIDFQSDELVKKIQDYANKNHDGNFNEAVRELIKKGIE